MTEKRDLKVVVIPTDELSSTNRVYFAPNEFSSSPCYVRAGKRKPTIFYGEESALIKPGTIAMNKVQRLTSKCSKGKEVPCEIFQPSLKNFEIKNVTVECKFKNERGFTPEIDGTEFVELCTSILWKHILQVGQDVPMNISEKFVIMNIKTIELYDVSEIVGSKTKNQDTSMGKVIKDTQFKLKVAKGSKLQFSNLPSIAAEGLFKGKTTFRDLGIGGLDEQLKTLFRRAFASRVYPKEIIEKFGIQHIKGILLHGPPGTGKTLTARQIGNILNSAPPKKINGPEILNKFVGESERNIRELFKEAEQEYQEKGESSQLHVIIFDEIDAICKRRGTVRSGTGVNDSVVNQLLSKIDGVDALNNVLIIGMTNRIDLIDEALLRSGRFEIKIEVGLPDEPGRYQIFDIHTATMRTNGVLHEDVDLYELARRTNNYSGAEIAGVCRSAVAYCLNKHIHFDDLEKTLKNLGKMSQKVKVKMADFDKALKEVKPDYGVEEDVFTPYLSQPLIEYSSRFKTLKKTLKSFMTQLTESKTQNLLTLLLAGERGCGKTSLAVHTACKSEYPFVKMISPQQMIGFTESSKANYIVKVFEQAYKSPLSVIIIDNIERLIDYIDMGPKFSNHVLQALLVIVNKLPPKKRKLMVIGTTSSKEQLGELNIVDAFNFVVNVPVLSKKKEKEIIKVMKVVGNFKEDDLPSIVQSLPDYIAMKKLLLVCEMAKSYVTKGEQISENAFLQSLIDCGVK